MPQPLRDQIADLAESDRLEVKLRAQAIKDEVLNRAPHYAGQPFDSALNEVCQSAAFEDHQTRTFYDDRTLRFASEMFEGLADREDVRALNADKDEDFIKHRRFETDYRNIAGILIDMVDEEFPIISSLTKSPGM